MKLNLPCADLLSPGELALLIANALQPPREMCRGIACIIGKRFNERQPFKVEVARQFVYKLSPAEHRQVEEQLALLPPLSGNMGDLQRTEFLHQFEALNPKLTWMPVLDAGIDSHFDIGRRDNIRKKHFNAIRIGIESGELLAIGAESAPAKHLGAVLPMAQVKVYLRRCGIEWHDRLANENEAPQHHADDFEMVSLRKTEERNEFDDVLDRAIIGSCGSLTVRATSAVRREIKWKVWAELIEMAKNEDMGLGYTSDNAAAAKLDRKDHSISFLGYKGLENKTYQGVCKLLDRRWHGPG